METLNIEKFSPKKAELVALADSYKALTINGVEDKEGYLAVDNARKELKTKRVQIQKDGKSLREEAVTFQRAVISKEKELIGIIEPIETELAEKQAVIEEEKQKIKRKESLPSRIAKLAEIEVVVTEDFLLLMDDAKFDSYLNERRAGYLEAKEAKMKELQEAAEKKAQEEQNKLNAEKKKIEDEKRKIEEEKLSIERDKQHQLDLEKARTEAAENAKKEAEEAAVKEKERLEKIEAEKLATEKAEKERLEKGKKYKAFLAQHEYVEGENFYLQKLDTKIVLFKKLGAFNI